MGKIFKVIKFKFMRANNNLQNLVSIYRLVCLQYIDYLYIHHNH